MQVGDLVKCTWKDDAWWIGLIVKFGRRNKDKDQVLIYRPQLPIQFMWWGLDDIGDMEVISESW